MDKISYALGMAIARNLRSMGVDTLSTEDFSAAVLAVISGGKTELTDQEAQITVQQFLQKKEEEQSRAMRADGEKYLADNAKKEGVIVTESGLQYEILTPALGQKPKATDTVTCHYEGRLIDGTIFDSNYDQPQPMACVPNQMIPGFGEALQQMPVGSEWEIYIPADKAYGEREMQTIKPNSVLIFKVKLVSIEAGQAGTHRSAASIHGGATGTIDDLRDDQVAGN